MHSQVKFPVSLQETWAILKEEPGAFLVAGGTDSIPRANQRIEFHPLYVCLDRVPGLKGWSLEGETYTIGAMTTLVEIQESGLDPSLGALLQAASQVASPQIRNRATIGGNILQENRCIYFNQSVSWRRQDCCFKLGGNLCYQYRGSKDCVALFQSDVAPALMALNGSVVLESPRGQRVLPLEQIYLNRGRNNKALEKDEVLTKVLIPADKRLRSAYVRETIRGSIDFPLISCAAAFWMEGERIAQAQIVVGCAGVRPARAQRAEGLLVEATLSQVPELLPKVVEEAKRVIMPFRDSRVDGPARKTLGGEAVRKAILSLLAPAGQ